ncbi:PLDc N-terminal domain-containing protein [Arthrobacter citreus]|uniref:PLDc N-terminal domain-containing protein n=1 Tax=Arthrobacter TaxID=1663 RepID=UPI001478E409|nr:PLDc N-terminal domain-containing protein [Arthrobacter gandavensis]
MATQGANPVIPNRWEFTVLGIGVLALLFLIVAVIGIARSRHLSGTAQAVWILVVLAFPVAGPILWLAIGRRSTTTDRDAEKSTESGVR